MPDDSIRKMAAGKTESVSVDDNSLDIELDLGFIESAEPWELQSSYFPSKVGGNPAWLDLKNLPSPSSLLCQRCHEPMVFLLQIYAPIDEQEDCFHRALFVFVCKKADCCSENSAENVVVFRCQLPRKNDFYSFEPPKRGKDHVGKTASDFCKVCNVCGCLAPKRCSQCGTNYCSEKHQVIDWKSGHKEICKAINTGDKGKERPTSNFLLPENEIVIEPENSDDESHKEVSKEKSDEERMKEYEDYVSQQQTEEQASSGDTLTKDLTDLEEQTMSKIDKQFKTFRQRVLSNPDQVLRYKKGGTPLWISSTNIPSTESIPDCPCGAKRHFEFQVMPQLLNYLKLDTTEKSIDWGTLVVYTCSKNCSQYPGYQLEFILKQDF